MSSPICPAAPIRKCVDTDNKEVKPGDLIKISRGGRKHWAVYVGDGDVVHLVPHGMGAGTGVVLKEKLEDVVEKNKWKVNNHLDNEYTPRPADDIVNNACSLVDTEKQYDLSKYNCEHFATKMRYGKPESRQVKAAITAEAPVATKMGRFASFVLGPSSSSDSAATIIKYFDMDKREIKPGDLIEILRGLYNHWAVYVGGGNIVHFVNTGLGSSSSDGGDVGGKVLKEKLQDVAGNNYCRINNRLDYKYRPHPANDIVEKACSLVDTELQYNLKKYNCEHFATKMRYGEPDSQQVKDAITAVAAGAAAAGAGGGAAAAAAGAGGAAAAAAAAAGGAVVAATGAGAGAAAAAGGAGGLAVAKVEAARGVLAAAAAARTGS
ncbi:uncharacterized protein LOC133450866 [Cololabis saira]|uniref:uncharacterized protein LOC133450866 n=1 Tax=Cololabis saira TaxID=129043 RepID=UPI002AD4143A|nr:uncharacterized protein LOC133450866 [Cololabis saira]